VRQLLLVGFACAVCPANAKEPDRARRRLEGQGVPWRAEQRQQLMIFNNFEKLMSREASWFLGKAGPKLPKDELPGQ
jgi:hypothetical protein